MKRKSGFTLTELLLVVIIITALAAGFVVTFGNLGEKARKDSAKAVLRTMFAAAHEYRSQYKTFPPDQSDIWPSYMQNPSGGTWTYTATGGTDTFEGIAESAKEGKITIDENGTLTETEPEPEP